MWVPLSIVFILVLAFVTVALATSRRSRRGGGTVPRAEDAPGQSER